MVMQSPLAEISPHDQDGLLDEWIDMQLQSGAFRAGTVSGDEVRSESRSLLDAFIRGSSAGNFQDIEAPEYDELRTLLSALSIDRARQGYSPSDTAGAIFSLKRVLLARLKDSFDTSSVAAFDEFSAYSSLLDQLGLLTFETYVKGREEIIQHQAEELLELSTPVVKIWDGVLAVPLIGTLDSARTQVVMENLLQTIVDTGSTIAIIDITGVPTVDTMVAQHLLKTVAAARLMGAECMISGIRPGIAQTIVHLGIDLEDVITKSSLSDAIALAVTRVGPRNGSSKNG